MMDMKEFSDVVVAPFWERIRITQGMSKVEMKAFRKSLALKPRDPMKAMG